MSLVTCYKNNIKRQQLLHLFGEPVWFHEVVMQQFMNNHNPAQMEIKVQVSVTDLSDI